MLAQLLSGLSLDSEFARVYYNLVEMSSSWNFPARASPSCESSEPSRAELEHFNFRAETELTIPTICMSIRSKFQFQLQNCNQSS